MKSGHKKARNAFIFITAIFALLFFSFDDISAAQKTPEDITATNPDLLQFRAGNHILGFAPDRVYLASTDHALSVQFIGTKGVEPKADTEASTSSTGTRVSFMGKVIYQNLWDGISLIYEATKAGITESSYHVAPGADVSKIRLRYNVPVRLRKDGSLAFKFDTGTVTESAPVAWQRIDGKKRAVKVASIVEGGTAGFQVGEYDRTQPLIIDPTYQWHTFYGSVDDDLVYGMTVDSSDNVYVTGYSVSTWNGPGTCSVTGTSPCPLHAHSGGSHDNLFVLKLDSSGAYQWHTFYGSTIDHVQAFGIAVDSGGNVYVTGRSYANWNGPGSCSLPGTSPCPLRAFNSGNEIFILKLNSGGTYQWHTFYGSDNDEGHGVAVDGAGNVYITGFSFNGGWIGPGNAAPLHGFSGNSGASNIVVLKLTGNGAYQWHTFYGALTNYHEGHGIALDGSSNVYVTGVSNEPWLGGMALSNVNPLNPFSGLSNANIIVLKLDSSGTYQWHTFYGSDSSYDYAYGVALDASGNVYVTGNSDGSWTGPSNAAPKHAFALPSSANIVVLKLTGSGAYVWHTFYGTTGSDDEANAIAIDRNGSVYVAGLSYATWTGPSGQLPLNPFSGADDIIILKLDSSGNYLWHTYYGSDSADTATGMVLDSTGNLYLAGYSAATWSGPSPANTAPIHAFSASNDIFVIRLSLTTCPNDAVLIGTSNYFPSIQSAYSFALDGDSLLMQAMQFGTDLSLSGVSVVLKGGYECDFIHNPGYTSLKGMLAVSGRTVTLENLIIK